ncbi:chemotaxis protein CheC [Paramaledivibacter caminithermalis]|jgi:chemotaxis protein CheC|uniref:Chemotaxis protein CheC n=1 Tax=Paramaledivibacter caminithermalis (strain DSM 15212 / CIP 107654 / DViRD3) TaxID=1121301 RepID=A0A1M6N6T5_PARC5|nr:chemotaxis protein CheC [Paramaledivibacter caminithermalis]SHJ91286.1 chemotaxis protein CheC [Paramaledivibacter caminithermalis DSM 15212]
MDNYLNNIDSLILDVLKEVGNIGAGNATTALAKMLNKKIDMTVPKVNVLDFSDVADLIGGAETIVCSTLFEIEGDLNGSIMFLLETEYSKKLVSLIMNGYEVKDIDDLAKSALKEIGNILSGAYVSSLSGLTGLNMKISVPSLAIDMAGAILSVPAIKFGQVSDKILIIETQFLEGNDNVKGYFLLVPDYDSYDILLRSLGVSTNG